MRVSNTPHTSVQLVILRVTVSVLILSDFTNITSVRAQTPYLFYPEFEFVYRNYNSVHALGRGNTGVADRGRIDLALLNPASLSPSGAFESFVSTGEKNPQLRYMEFRIGELTDFLGARQKGLPYAFGTAMKLSESVSAGLLYYRHSDILLDLTARVETDPEDSSVHFILKDRGYLRAEALTVPVSLRIYKNISLGLEVQRVHYYIHLDYFEVTEEQNYNIYNFKLGTIIDYNRNFSVAITFLPEKRKKLTTEVENHQFAGTYEFLSPFEFQLGLKYKQDTRPLTILFDIFYQKTSEVEYLDDHVDFRFGAEYDLWKNISVRTGFFVLRDNRDLDMTSLNHEYDVTYLTFGTGLSLGRTSFDLSMITTRLTPGCDYRNTSFSLGFHLPL